MKIDDARKMLFSDTLVPDVFISEHMASLSGTAVKIYLYALHVSGHHATITGTELARRLDSDWDAIKAGVFELSQKSLVEYNDKKKTITILDIKEQELSRYYRPRTSAPPAEVITRMSKQPERDKLIGEINKSFFHGMMGYSWYQAIDDWFERFQFEPEVVYALFNECASRNKLSSKNYISAVAKDWNEKGVASYQDLNRYVAMREKTEIIRNGIGKKLRKNMSEYDDKLVEKWVKDFNYDMDVIDIALQYAVRIGQPNLNYFDSILSRWYESGLKNAADVKAHEQARQEKNKQTKRKPAVPAATEGQTPGRGRYQNLGNFDQREYSDEFLDSFNLDLFADESHESEDLTGEFATDGDRGREDHVS